MHTLVVRCSGDKFATGLKKNAVAKMLADFKRPDLDFFGGLQLPSYVTAPRVALPSYILRQTRLILLNDKDWKIQC